VAHEGLIYLFGGVGPGGAAQRSTFIYNPSLNQWSSGANMPTAREHLMAAAAGQYIYVIGGRSVGARNVVERYHPDSNTWSTMTPMPTARSASACAAFGPRIIVAGGEVPMLHAVNEVYDILTNTWNCQAPMAIPRHGIAAVRLDDRILTPAGGVEQGLGPTMEVDSFAPERWPGDFDGDGDADGLDFERWVGCLAGPNVGVSPDCALMAFDADSDVDLVDYGAFQDAFTDSWPANP
jgi:N-acetylneuraminic acid mutarotase